MIFTKKWKVTIIIGIVSVTILIMIIFTKNLKVTILIKSLTVIRHAEPFIDHTVKEKSSSSSSSSSRWFWGSLFGNIYNSYFKRMLYQYLPLAISLIWMLTRFHLNFIMNFDQFQRGRGWEKGRRERQWNRGGGRRTDRGGRRTDRGGLRTRREETEEFYVT